MMMENQPTLTYEINGENCTREKVDIALLNNLLNILKDNEEMLIDLSDHLSIISNDTRLKIFFLLREANQLSPCDLSDLLHVSVPAISQQLRRLKDLKIVKSQRDGRTIYYSLTDNPFNKDIVQLISDFNDESRT
ncbi:winged helix-turn-helix transcriptional regulator [Crocinitomix catalasitica]|nr:winged helix-turn-helix transcriptional regulator [Crocinitomix catalasitica]